MIKIMEFILRLIFAILWLLIGLVAVMMLLSPIWLLWIIISII